ncbi:uncharacterized protein A1O5_05545 [Cladophialophora psammophila CBS 110553]|uniref:Oxidoreductase n=1 Tax=Cladophialophora psammophila CBS 110553 TaxID=1182543 RepID=W9X478_9EURO|nr:uncharacterized protein A1O5_05545 [Cladophialophora psammophila CBS 110553]EXJ71736.1 hypothetical protein A1O5_05545 [Cladophialophora psammophila CBS 110553]
MAFAYKQVLLVGATAGIGAAMADRLVQQGTKVIAVGRRQERLDLFVQKHGKGNAGAIRFDIRERENMDKFVQDVTAAYPDLDCIFLNAGVQSPIDLSLPEKVDLAAFHSEVAINFSSLVDLSIKFLPFLMNKRKETSLIFTGSNLALVPASTLPAYSVSKAALNAFLLCLRDQLRNSSVKVIELSPPPVQTELHDYLGAERGRTLGMPIDEFTEAAYEGLASGSDQIVIGSPGPAEIFNDIVDKRRTLFQNLAKRLRGET